jgi:hypothetical protein
MALPKWLTSSPPLTQARAILAELYGEDVLRKGIRVTVKDENGHCLRLELPPEKPASPWSPMHRAILQAAKESSRPLTAEAMAKAAGYKCHSGFRSALTELDRANLLRRTPDGYVWLGQAEEAEEVPDA